MKTLILGANGFLGRNLVKKCLDMKWDVDCVYHLRKNFISRKVRLINIENLFKRRESYDLVFLLSAYIPYGNLNSIDKRLLDVNVLLPFKISERFKKSKIIYSSSVSVYGNHEDIITENTPSNRPNNYGLSKLAGEFIIKFHPKYQIIRFSSLYGSGMFQKTFIAQKIAEVKKARTITLFGDGSRFQDYLYINDAIDYLIAAAHCKECGVYLGVNGRSYSNTEVGEIIRSLFPDCKIKYINSDNNPSFTYNNLLTRKILKFSPKISLEEGIKRMINQE